jgi:Kef-type K+ transport system membrane component KefB
MSFATEWMPCDLFELVLSQVRRRELVDWAAWKTDGIHQGPFLVWSLIILLAWLVGEYLWLMRFPRVVSYAIVGLLAGGWLRTLSEPDGNDLVFLADASIGLLLSELGFRFSPIWFLRNPKVAWLSFAESMSTFVVTYLLCRYWFEMDSAMASVLASLCVATSPVAILRITRELQSSGPITNIIVNLSAMNCIICVVLYHILTGFLVQYSTGAAVWAPGYIFLVILVSLFSGVVSSVLLKWSLTRIRMSNEVRAFSIAMSSIVLTALLSQFRMSPMAGAIALGITMRAIGVKMTGIHQDFGSLGRFLTVFLFVFISSQLQWPSIVAGLPMGLAILCVRFLAKFIAIGGLGGVAGLNRQQSLLAGLGMMPASAFIAVMLEQTRVMGVDLFREFHPIFSFVFLAELLGPIATSIAIRIGKEANPEG